MTMVEKIRISIEPASSYPDHTTYSVAPESRKGLSNDLVTDIETALKDGVISASEVRRFKGVELLFGETQPVMEHIRATTKRVTDDLVIADKTDDEDANDLLSIATNWNVLKELTQENIREFRTLAKEIAEDGDSDEVKATGQNIIRSLDLFLNDREKISKAPAVVVEYLRPEIKSDEGTLKEAEDAMKLPVQYWREVSKRHGATAVIAEENTKSGIEILRPSKEEQLKPRATKFANMAKKVKARLAELNKQGGEKFQYKWGMYAEAQVAATEFFKHQPYIEQEFSKRGLPLWLAVLPIIETQMNVEGVSDVGAVGPQQLMPRTGSSYGLEIRPDEGIDERKNVILSAGVAAELLADNIRMIKKFCEKEGIEITDEWAALLATSAYHAGIGTLTTAMTQAKKEIMAQGKKKPDAVEIAKTLYSTDFKHGKFRDDSKDYPPQLIPIIELIYGEAKISDSKPVQDAKNTAPLVYKQAIVTITGLSESLDMAEFFARQAASEDFQMEFREMNPQFDWEKSRNTLPSANGQIRMVMYDTDVAELKAWLLEQNAKGQGKIFGKFQFETITPAGEVFTAISRS